MTCKEVYTGSSEINIEEMKHVEGNETPSHPGVGCPEPTDYLAELLDCEILILLKGSVLVRMNVESQIVTAPETVTIPACVFHSVTPIERETKMVAVISPPEPAYVVEKPE